MRGGGRERGEVEGREEEGERGRKEGGRKRGRGGKKEGEGRPYSKHR